MSKEQRERIASLGGRSVPSAKRSFAQDRALASEAGRKGGQRSQGRRRAGERPRGIALGGEGGDARGQCAGRKLPSVRRESVPLRRRRSAEEQPQARSRDEIPHGLSRQARLCPLPRAEGPPGGRRGRPLLRAEARCPPPALRSSARARRRAQELGRHARAEPRVGEKRLAVHTEDHPLEYLTFEGVIPQGQYGGGTMIVWDEGRWAPEGDPRVGYEKGHLAFALEGAAPEGPMAPRAHAAEAAREEGAMAAAEGRRRVRATAGQPRDHGGGDHLGPLRTHERRACARRRSPGRPRRARQSRKRAQARVAGPRPRARRKKGHPAALRRAVPRDARRAGAPVGGRMGARDQVRRLSPAGADRWRQGEAPDPQRARLDGEIRAPSRRPSRG